MNRPVELASATALATASRWVATGSIALSMTALLGLLVEAPDQPQSVTLLSLCVLILPAQIYLALRIEFDHGIFEAAGSADHAEAYLESFDASRRELGLGRSSDEHRSMVQRVRGMMRLIRSSGALFLVQLALTLGAVWILRWSL